jgi:hypothetical protein
MEKLAPSNADKMNYNIAVATAYLELIEKILTLRDMYEKIPNRQLPVTDEETLESLESLRTLMDYTITILRQTEWNNPEHNARTLLIDYAALAFADVYFGFIDQSLAFELLTQIKPRLTKSENIQMWEKVEILIDRIYDDPLKCIFKDIKEMVSKILKDMSR